METACCQETPLEHRAGVTGDSDTARFEGLEGEQRGIREVS